ncbi:YHS domain-containing (seleno)protein [Paraliomyxa miuraensis]|uniref:YHS domain-containing (seleno)protein n=1 Tax=Paraliomyxa miuraensis TaxID=376150 RepID=UPI0022519F86|nr:YHS domain-containing (seleno)protein [Paraliomyxa miuraensis]MCX4240569.1 hypothetical protein [Paraliomyxa miuraensis]
MPAEPKLSLCLSVAALFLAGCAGKRGDADAPVTTRVKCLGVNACSGQGQCAAQATDGSELNACGGQNACSGKGWLEVEQSECTSKGGTVLEVVSQSAQTCVADPSVPRLSADGAGTHYNLGDGGLAIEGYDPVAYFPEGGGAPQPGRADLELQHEGVTYRFATPENLERFRAAPGRYEPAYGGWCAYAMGKTGRTVKVDPEAFLIEGDRLLLFYRTKMADTREKWAEEPGQLRPRAEREWSQRTGECPTEAAKD